MSRCIYLSLTMAFLLGGLFVPKSSLAYIEVGRSGQEPLRIEDVYLREGTAFVAIDDVLSALELQGDWDSVAHVYKIKTPHGSAVISPGSQFLKIGENFIPISHRPRFIDGKLRISETFLLRQLAPLFSEPIYYRNYDPPETVENDDPLERLFSFLLRKKESVAEGSKRIISIDPAHGGADSGVLALDGTKEKDLSLAVAQRLEKLLKMHQDAPVIMTRDGDYAMQLEQRLQVVADAEADVLLSLHAQSFLSSNAAGINLYVQPQTEQDLAGAFPTDNSSLVLAEHLRDNLTRKGFVVHEIRESLVYPLGRGDLPRVLVEMGCLNDPSDLSALKDPMRQQDFARALFDGLGSFFETYTRVSP